MVWSVVMPTKMTIAVKLVLLTNAIINGNGGGDQIIFNTGANAISASTVYGGMMTPSTSNTKGVYIFKQVRTEMISTLTPAQPTTAMIRGDASKTRSQLLEHLFVEVKLAMMLTITETARCQFCGKRSSCLRRYW